MGTFLNVVIDLGQEEHACELGAKESHGKEDTNLLGSEVGRSDVDNQLASNLQLSGINQLQMDVGAGGNLSGKENER